MAETLTTLEDTPTTAGELAAQGIPADVGAAGEALTRGDFLDPALRERLEAEYEHARAVLDRVSEELER